MAKKNRLADFCKAVKLVELPQTLLYKIVPSVAPTAVPAVGS